MEHKSPQLPNGYCTTSDRIRHVRVFPDRSLSLTRVFVEVLEDTGLVYRGIVDLNRIEITQHRSDEGGTHAQSGAAQVHAID